MPETINLTAQSVAEFISATAARTPTPGGGSVAGVVGALGTGLGEMALAFTRGKKKFAEHEAAYEIMANRLEKARQMFMCLVAEDMAAYALYQEASRYEGPDKARKEQLALAAAINVPREMAKVALVVLDELASLLDRCNRYLLTDLAGGAVLLEAVVKLCDYNVRINAPNCADKKIGEEILKSSTLDCEKAKALVERIEASVKQQI
ncbi:MAG: cyclodeaminase/cyclohydrolase family protein [Planctomycetes bacterium]|nr:cyclodeaminase/cyclohydrolase family protein [Planctomycetota bacterium]